MNDKEINIYKRAVMA